jgi:hypothetical protein
VWLNDAPLACPCSSSVHTSAPNTSSALVHNKPTVIIKSSRNSDRLLTQLAITGDTAYYSSPDRLFFCRNKTFHRYLPTFVEVEYSSCCSLRASVNPELSWGPRLYPPPPSVVLRGGSLTFGPALKVNLAQRWLLSFHEPSPSQMAYNRPH